MFGWVFEVNASSRFWNCNLIKICELVIWTQPSGPLCLWQCFSSDILAWRGSEVGFLGAHLSSYRCLDLTLEKIQICFCSMPEIVHSAPGGKSFKTQGHCSHPHRGHRHIAGHPLISNEPSCLLWQRPLGDGTLMREEKWRSWVQCSSPPQWAGRGESCLPPVEQNEYPAAARQWCHSCILGWTGSQIDPEPILILYNFK